MKNKNYILLCIALLSLALMGNSQAEKGGIKLKDYPETSILKTSLQLTSVHELNHIIILPNSNFNQEEAAKMISRLDRLPTSLLAKIYRNDIVVKLFTGNLTDNRTATHLSGVVPRGYVKKVTWDNVPGMGGSKTVLVKIGSSNQGNGHNSINLEFHELAHSIDRHVYRGLRYQQHFLDIWNQEKDQLFPGNHYFLTFPEEYFAESFAYFYMGGKYREKLKRSAPMTYQLIRGLS
ncbi:toxin [Bacillus sp. V3B]|uniref:anthrax toxin lethal factor-related metalloendopeptidase n=1 Tax=Bacillus sp. V3B TaxID=2804915 RepID=UPI002108C7F6|nr:toxin [Bacillus sp. V3B]MCQ6275154.1 toxin [Bacillus sp. V3B]